MTWTLEVVSSPEVTPVAGTFKISLKTDARAQKGATVYVVWLNEGTNGLNIDGKSLGKKRDGAYHFRLTVYSIDDPSKLPVDHSLKFQLRVNGSVEAERTATVRIIGS